jgi:CRISPR/Cas system-associated protein endoribonuclease Cas2
VDKITVPWTILTAVISALSALLGVHISNKAQEKRLKIQFENEAKVRSLELKKKKLEEMFILFQKWEMDITCLYLRFIPVFKGEANAAAVQNAASENSLQEKGDHQKFQAILNLYFPELKEAFGVVMNKRGVVLKYCNGGIAATPDNLDAFCSEQNAFELITANFRSKLADVAVEL